MCGIAGIYTLKGNAAIERDILHRMNESQFHRGPDEGGLMVEAGIGLAHRRLSIIDLSSGQQPMTSTDGQTVVVFNGEIYNFKLIRAELEQLGYQFQTHCDTEVILYAWQAWRTECVQRFRGMFAFAIWDRQHDTLFLARDRLGIKPLYYCELSNGQVIFGSELKVLTAHPLFCKTICLEAVEDYFAYGYVPDPKTIYQNVLKLEPGHTLLLQRGQALPEPECYWDLPFKPVPHASNDQDLGEDLIKRFKEAVDIRLVADVPLGAFLSGGVDSSAVVAMMAQLNDDPVNTCSITFDDPNYNEAEYSAKVAEQYQTAHLTRQVDVNDYALIDKLAEMYDEPYADASALPTYRVCELAREKVTVTLSGDGADELLAGYRRYKFQCYEDQLRSYFPDVIRKPVFGVLAAIYPKLDWAPRCFRAKSTFQALARDSVEGYFNSVSLLHDEIRQPLFSASFKQRLNGYHAVNVLRGYQQKAPVKKGMSLIQYLDCKTYLVGDILTKVDRASMAHSLEVRVPFLDHKLVEWMSGLPEETKLKGGEGKYILKKSLESHLPNDIMYRPKMGFRVPIGEWFKGPLKQQVRAAVLSDRMLNTGFFNADYIRRMLDQHQSGRRDFTAPLWTLLMFDAFLKHAGL